MVQNAYYLVRKIISFLIIMLYNEHGKGSKCIYKEVICMKRIISAALIAAMAAGTLSQFPIKAAAAGKVYELENGTIYDAGENATKVVTMTGASSGKAIDLKDSGDSVTISVNAASAGMYKTTMRYSQPYDKGGKYQNLLVNGTNIGQILCDYTEKNSFAEVSTSAYLKKGENQITIQGSWGWTYLDSLTIEESGTSTGNLSQIPMLPRRQSHFTVSCVIPTEIILFLVSRSPHGWAVRTMKWTSSRGQAEGILHFADLIIWAMIFQAVTAAQKHGMKKAASLRYAGIAEVISAEVTQRH